MIILAVQEINKIYRKSFIAKRTAQKLEMTIFILQIHHNLGEQLSLIKVAHFYDNT